MGDTQFHMRIRQSPGHHSLLPEHHMYNHKCPVYLQCNPGYYYGYVYFRQVKDKLLPRGYFQKSVVIISRLPFIRLFTEVCALIAPEFFENGEPSIEAACHDIDHWPWPDPGETFNLPLLGTILQTQIPAQTSKVCNSPQVSSNGSSCITSLRGEPLVGMLPVMLPSVHEINLFRCFFSLISHIHLLWELVLTAEPIVVMAASPNTCSEMVQALVSMVVPLMYCADYRPYFTIHDSEFKEYTTRAHAPPPVILGAAPTPRPFNPDDFVATLGTSGPQLTTGIKGDWVGLYRRFFRSPNFSGWFNARYREVSQKLQALQLEALSDADVKMWVQGKQEVEVVDMILRIRQKLEESELEELHLSDATRNQLKSRMADIIYTLPEDLKTVLKTS
uniref:UDENN domain-containing protein n=1 Tax=Timema douglasi TaxID=61478 RepID=A0A7R8Z7D9_TIMDO|nr:unnamed protein product [Timema douglasi]